MVRRITAAIVALFVAAPAGLGAVFADPAPEMMGCSPFSKASKGDDAPDEPVITRRCCCDIDRRSPTDGPAVPAIANSDDRDAGPALALPAVRSIDAPVQSVRLPEPRGPPPRTTLLLKKTSFLL